MRVCKKNSGFVTLVLPDRNIPLFLATQRERNWSDKDIWEHNCSWNEHRLLQNNELGLIYSLRWRPSSPHPSSPLVFLFPARSCNLKVKVFVVAGATYSVVYPEKYQLHFIFWWEPIPFVFQKQFEFLFHFTLSLPPHKSKTHRSKRLSFQAPTSIMESAMAFLIPFACILLYTCNTIATETGEQT